MAIAIRGIRISSISIIRTDDGKEKVSGNYELISTNDKVLAKQGFNGYNDIEVAMSGDTMKLFNDFMVNMKKDIQGILGLTEE